MVRFQADLLGTSTSAGPACEDFQLLSLTFGLSFLVAFLLGLFSPAASPSSLLGYARRSTSRGESATSEREERKGREKLEKEMRDAGGKKGKGITGAGLYDTTNGRNGEISLNMQAAQSRFRLEEDI